MKTSPTISVIMPTYKQSRFIERAVASLQAQSYSDWELIIVNDASPDDTDARIEQFLSDKRISCIRFQENKGLGYALNAGIRAASADLIGYLPSDDIIFDDHLTSLLQILQENPGAIAAYSGVRHHYNREASGIVDGYTLQLVQVLHRKFTDVWLERSQLVTDDMEVMGWQRLRERGEFIGSGRVSCDWVDHPHQRHKIIREPIGGLNLYKLYYNVHQPLRYKSTTGNLIDEQSYFAPFRNTGQDEKRNGLKIVLVGELAYNAERIVALEEHGHKLYGLWMKDPYWYNYVGPLPFGNITDIPHDNWVERVKEIQPDVIYALLNWQAVPFAHEVLKNNPGIPFVWHFKEGPFICLEKGSWSELVDLHNESDGQIYSSPEMRDWFLQFVKSKSHTAILDGDLPKREWFTEERSPLLSDDDGEIHTVVPGRPIGLHPHNVQELAAQKIHLHFYGDFTHGQWKEWIIKTHSMAPGYLHIHPNCTQEQWVREFSRYDAGWLHFFKSSNHGEMMRANWVDLNYPARIATLAAAGLPMLQRNNDGHIVATQSLVKSMDLGLFFTSMEELGTKLRNKKEMQRIRDNVWNKRMAFCFDTHVDSLVDFFRTVIARRDKPAAVADDFAQSAVLDVTSR